MYQKYLSHVITDLRRVLITLNNSIDPGIYTINFSWLAFRGLPNNELLEKSISVGLFSLKSGRIKYRIEQNRTWDLQGILSQGKIRLSVVFDENAFDEVTFRRTGNSTKTFDEVSQ